MTTTKTFPSWSSFQDWASCTNPATRFFVRRVFAGGALDVEVETPDVGHEFNQMVSEIHGYTKHCRDCGKTESEHTP